MNYFDPPGFFPCRMIAGERLGRYEYRSGTSEKFYHVIEDTSGQFWAFYGRIGSINPQKNLLGSSLVAVADRLASKRSKGYDWVPGHVTYQLEAIQAKLDRLDAVLPSAEEPVANKPRVRF